MSNAMDPREPQSPVALKSLVLSDGRDFQVTNARGLDAANADTPFKDAIPSILEHNPPPTESANRSVARVSGLAPRSQSGLPLAGIVKATATEIR